MPFLDVVFKRSSDMLEGVVGLLAGNFIHVEMVPSDQECMFTSFMFENFSKNKKSVYDSSYQTIRIVLTAGEHTKLCSLLSKWSERVIPYNYMDLLLAGGYYEEPTDAETVSSLFCSQAVVIALRNSLEPSELLTELLSVDSRSLLPQGLFEMLSKYARPIKVD